MGRLLFAPAGRRKPAAIYLLLPSLSMGDNGKETLKSELFVAWLACTKTCGSVSAMRENFEETRSGLNTATDGLVSLLSAIVDSSDDPILSKTLDGIITSWNRAAERVFGYTAAEAIGRPITMIVPPDRVAEENYVLGRIREGDRVENFETVRLARDGRRLNVSLTISPIKDARGVVVGASNITRDIGERKRHEREREQLLAREQEAHRRLAEALEARDEFIAEAAHELRNPLNVFLLTLQLLHRISGDPQRASQVRGLIEKSRIQLGRLSALVDRLLDVSRIRSGSLDLYYEYFDLNAVIKEVTGRFVNEYPTVPISLDLEAGIEGRWDRIRLDQVISNLISNAIKYGMHKPISVTAMVDGGEAVISVRDQGNGIPHENLARIFDRFKRVAPRSGNEGLGLGLWITKRIVEAHGGTIRAESEPGKGAVFIVRVPLRR